MTKPKITGVQSLDHCQIGKHYYFDSTKTGKTIAYYQRKDELRFSEEQSEGASWFADDLVLLGDWRISLEPVPIPEVER